MRRLLVLVLLILSACTSTESDVSLNQPGAWSWFSSPQAVHHDGLIYIAYATQTHAEVGAFEHGTQTWSTFQLGELNVPDDHSVPVVGIRPDGRILTVWAEHSRGPLYRRVSTNPGDISSWGSTMVLGTAPDTYTYANLMRLDSEDTWYLFTRQGPGPDFDQVYFTSTDEGDTWSGPTTLITGTGVPYARWSVTADRIDLAITNNHPEFDDENSLYHAYYDGTWRASDGTPLGTPPFDVATDFTQVYDGADDRAWVWDMAPGPVIGFTTHPSETDHRYQYATWNGATWNVNEIVAAGGSVDESGDDPYYSGGLGLDHADPGTVYLSREVGGDLWLVEQWQTADAGANWSMIEQMTPSPTTKNFRPVVPLGSGPIDVVWIAGGYHRYTQWTTELAAIVDLPGGDVFRFDMTGRGFDDGRFAADAVDVTEAFAFDDAGLGFDVGLFG